MAAPSSGSLGIHSVEVHNGSGPLPIYLLTNDTHGVPCITPPNTTSENCSNSDMWGNGSATFASPFDVPYIKGILIFCYVFVFCCCVLGNLLVIVVVLKNRKMRTVTNFFLANLAIADFCVGVFCVIPNLSHNLYDMWYFGWVMCKVYYFVEHMSCTASIIILTAISAERYLAIIYPMRSKQITTMTRLKVAIIFIWLISAAYNAPLLWMYGLTAPITNPETGESFAWCVMEKEVRVNKGAYAMLTFFLWYLIPLFLMVGMYTKIAVVLWESSSMSNIAVGRSGAPPLLGHRGRKRKNAAATKGMKVTYCGMKSSNDGKVTVSVSECNHEDDATTPDDEDSTVLEDLCHQRNRNLQDPTKAVSRDGSDVDMENLKETTTSDSDGQHIQMCLVHMPRSRSENTTNISPRTTPPRITKSHSSPSTRINAVIENNRGKRLSPHVPRATHSNGGQARGCRTAKTWTKSSTENALQARRKAIRLLIAVVVCFAVCVLPYHARILWQIWRTGEGLSVYHNIFPVVSYLVLYFNSGLNPFLYAFMSDNFRRSMKEALSCGRRLGRNRGTITASTKTTATHTAV